MPTIPEAPQKKTNKYALPDYKNASIMDIIKYNTGFECQATNQLRDHIQLFKDIQNFKYDPDSWYTASTKNTQRIKLIMKFCELCSKTQVELLNIDKFREILNTNIIKELCNKQNHKNFSINENEFNMLLTQQGSVLHIFLNLYLKKDMRFKDKIDSDYIEFNNPYTRERIREYNTDKDPVGYFYQNNFELGKFCMMLLNRFFPMMNGIWCDHHHFTHVVVLEITKTALEYGFFNYSQVPALTSVLVRVTHSLKKLEEAWNERYDQEQEKWCEEFAKAYEESGSRNLEDIFHMKKVRGHQMNDLNDTRQMSMDGMMNSSDYKIPKLSARDIRNSGVQALSGQTNIDLIKKTKVYSDYWHFCESKDKLLDRIQDVADNIAKCKQHIAQIIMQLITLHYDDRFYKVYPTYIYKKFAFINHEVEGRRMKEEIDENFPFFQNKFNNNILEILLNYLSDNTSIAGIKIQSISSRASIEKAFMYVCTAERDDFINSMRMITASDLQFFEFHLNESSSSRHQAINIRVSLIRLIDHLSKGGFGIDGEIDREIDLISDHSKVGKERGLIVNQQIKISSIKKITKILNVKQNIKSTFNKSMSMIRGAFTDNDKSILGFEGKSDNIIVCLNKIAEGMIKLMVGRTDEKSFRVSLSRQNIPVILLALLDYVSEYLTPIQINENWDLAYLINTEFKQNLQNAYNNMYDVLYLICQDNNIAKGQIFKGDGAYHLQSLLQRHDLPTMNFMLKITTEEINIGAYISRGLYDTIADIYKDMLGAVISSFAQNDMNGKKFPDDAEGAFNYKRDVKDISVYKDYIKFVGQNESQKKIKNEVFLNNKQKAIIPKNDPTIPTKMDMFVIKESKEINYIREDSVNSEGSNRVNNSDSRHKMAPALPPKDQTGSEDEIDGNTGVNGHSQNVVEDCNDIFSEVTHKTVSPKDDKPVSPKEDEFFSVLPEKNKTKPLIAPFPGRHRNNSIFQRGLLSNQQPIDANENVQLLEKYCDKDLPCITNPDFNPEPYVFLILMNRFWDQLYKKEFLNARIRIRNMLSLQEILFKPISEELIKKAIENLEDEQLKSLGVEDLIDRVNFKFTNEALLMDYILKNQLEMPHRMQLQLNVCTSSIRVMNKVSKSVFSRKVMDYMKQPCKLIIKHLSDINFDNLYNHVPYGKNSEFIKLLRFYAVVPNAGWQIDRIPVFEKDNTHCDTAAHKLVVDLLKKAYQFEEKRFADGQDYLQAGIQPMVYKYVYAFYNLTNYKNKSCVIEGLQKMQDLVEIFQLNNELFCRYSSTYDKPKGGEMMTWDKMEKDCSESMYSQKNKDKKLIGDEFKRLCRDLLENILVYFDGWPQHMDLIVQYQPISYKQFLDRCNYTRFQVEVKDPEMVEKLRVLNAQIQNYKECKQAYMWEDHNQRGQKTFQKKNRDNIRGIIDTLSERLFWNRDEDSSDMCSLNPAINNYWLNPSIFYYVQTLELLFTSGKFAREAFYYYLIEYKDEETKIIDDKRPGMLSLLLKLNSDLLFFQTSKPTVNEIWWMVWKFYSLVNKFFKNLCEGNYMPMKHYQGSFIPQSKFDPEFNKQQLNVIALKMEEVNYQLKFSMICENVQPVISVTDQDTRIIPMLNPQLNCVIELIEGPCIENIQKVYIQSPSFHFYPTIIRLLDDIDHPFYLLKDALQIFLLTMCSGGDKDIIKAVKNNLSAGMLEEQIVRITKKMYVRERLKEGISRGEYQLLFGRLLAEDAKIKSSVENEQSSIGAKYFIENRSQNNSRMIDYASYIQSQAEVSFFLIK